MTTDRLNLNHCVVRPSSGTRNRSAKCKRDTGDVDAGNGELLVLFLFATLPAVFWAAVVWLVAYFDGLSLSPTAFVIFFVGMVLYLFVIIRAVTSQ